MSQNLRETLGFLLIALGVVAALYAGVWWAFIGGIIQVIEAVKATPTDVLGLVFGIVRIMFCGVVASVVAFIVALPGWAMVKRRGL